MKNRIKKDDWKPKNKLKPIVRQENIVKENLKTLIKMDIEFQANERKRNEMKEVDIKELFKKAEFKQDGN